MKLLHQIDAYLTNSVFVHTGVGLWGVTGSSLIILSIVMCGASFEMRSAKYPIYNHFISELGDIKSCEFHHIFNYGLMLSGSILLVFMWGIGRLFKTIWGDMVAVSGVFTSVCCVLVGAFPVYTGLIHATVAMAFFSGGLITAVFSILATALQRSGRPKVLPTKAAIAWIGVLGVYASFMCQLLLVDKIEVTKRTQVAEGSLPVLLQAFDRGAGICWVTFLEWTIFLSVTLSILSVGLYTLTAGKKPLCKKL